MTDHPSPPSTLAIIGAGAMGSGIALLALYADFTVILQDPYPDALERARLYLEKFLAKRDMSDRLGRVTLTTRLDDLATADVVIEAALESLDLKREIFAKLDAVCRPDAILASNTSTLSITAIAAATTHPARIAGLHFFNPPAVLKLVEIVQGMATSGETVRTLEALATRLGKTPVVARDTPGFIVNRVARPYYGEALRLLGEGAASHVEIDQLLEKGAGFRMGPFRLMDLIGIDINATAMRSMYEQTFGEPRYRPHWIQMLMLSSGNLGQKTGKGFYDYPGDAVSPEISPAPQARTGGAVWLTRGRWDNGAESALRAAGFEIQTFLGGTGTLAAVVLTNGPGDGLADALAHLDEIDARTPVFVPCNETTLHAILPFTSHPERIVGYDALFFGRGAAAALIPSPTLNVAVRKGAESFLHALGCAPLWITDSPGLILSRVIGMLINEAVFAVLEGVADPEKIDLAMQLGVNYPRGLIEWGRELGWARLVSVLDHLRAEYGEERYRACALMRRWAREI